MNLENKVDKHIKLTDDISVDLKWHTMKDRVEDLQKKTETETGASFLRREQKL